MSSRYSKFFLYFVFGGCSLVCAKNINQNRTASKTQTNHSATKSQKKSEVKKTAPRKTAIELVSQNIQQIFAQKRKSAVKVVGVHTEGENKKSFLFGSGFFTDPSGYILTTATVVQGVSQIWVEYQGISYACNVIGFDTVSNLAVLKTTELPNHFQFISIPHYSKYFSPMIGEILVSIGSTSGMEPSPSMGIVSGKHITFGERVFTSTYLRTSLPIFGGESGSVVLSSDGKICGILIASIPEMQSSFVIPICAVSKIYRSLITTHKMVYCSAGFNAVEKFNETGDKQMTISSVVEGSDASKAGILVGDVIVSIDSQPISSANQIADILFFKSPGDTIEVQVCHNKAKITKTVKLSSKN